MAWWAWLALALGVVAVVWLALVAVLLVAGRREEARALAGFIPDCLILVSRLMADHRVSRRRKLLLIGLLGYLALPFDLIPDFIPIAGHYRSYSCCDSPDAESPVLRREDEGRNTFCSCWSPSRRR